MVQLFVIVVFGGVLPVLGAIQLRDFLRTRGTVRARQAQAERIVRRID